MTNSASAAAMLAFIQTETPRLCRGVAFQPRPMDAAAIYEAYVYTCVVEALESLQRYWPQKVRWQVVSPSTMPNTLVLRKKACSLKSAADKYGYILISVNGDAYELHTDVPAEGKSGVLNEIDVILLKEAACDRIRQGLSRAPTASDIVLLIEAKCYSSDSSLELGIGRGFLGLRNAEFGGHSLGYLISTANNDHIQDMVTYHGRPRKTFWPRLDDRPEKRNALIQELARQLSYALLGVPKKAKGTRRPKRTSARPSSVQAPSLPFE